MESIWPGSLMSRLNLQAVPQLSSTLKEIPKERGMTESFLWWASISQPQNVLSIGLFEENTPVREYF